MTIRLIAALAISATLTAGAGTAVAVAAPGRHDTGTSAAAGSPAWTQQDHRKDRHRDTDRERRVPAGFGERTTVANGVRINYVSGGSGPTLVLLHGYPQTWWMWRDVLPELAQHYTVVAPDLRGAGRSDAPEDGYDKATMAADVHALLQGLGLDQDVRIVGHDIGTMVAYAYAAAHPTDVDRLVLTEAPIPDEGLYSFPSVTPQGPGFWNFGFFTLDNGLPERTINGREEAWVDGFTDWLEVDKDGVDDRDVAEYARWLRDDAHLRASFEYFRALPQDVADNQGYVQQPLTMPVLAVGADASLGTTVEAQVDRYATDVQGYIVEDSGHWVFEEQPDVMTEVLLDFLD